MNERGRGDWLQLAPGICEQEMERERSDRLEKEEAVLYRRKSGFLPEEEWFSAITGDSEKDIGPLPALGKV
ncbi:hypothetical protein M5K25_006833 [Dendrobium thyrsiflorum]|uniref:Uncharacterized protein n=1 Tax=Dendrobium thyrsiflorum TaxID=117978 RepID=A0ABD0VCT9_DENTH